MGFQEKGAQQCAFFVFYPRNRKPPVPGGFLYDLSLSCFLFCFCFYDKPFEKVSDAAQDAIDAELANTASHMEPTVERDEKGSTRQQCTEDKLFDEGVTE